MAEVRASLPEDTPIEVWFQDEARGGQKNTITRRWAKRGTRPTAAKDQRTKSAYIFGAICPDQGKAAGLVLPPCNTKTMTLHLAEIATAVAPGAHAIVIMDQAGWHMTGKLKVPPNISIIPLPAKCPELKPVENVWQFMRNNWLSNRSHRLDGETFGLAQSCLQRITSVMWPGRSPVWDGGKEIFAKAGQTPRRHYR